MMRYEANNEVMDMESDGFQEWYKGQCESGQLEDTLWEFLINDGFRIVRPVVSLPGTIMDLLHTLFDEDFSRVLEIVNGVEGLRKQWDEYLMDEYEAFTRQEREVGDE